MSRPIDHDHVLAEASQRWQASASLREEFGHNRGAYVALAIAEAKGQYRAPVAKVVGSARTLLASDASTPAATRLSFDEPSGDSTRAARVSADTGAQFRAILLRRIAERRAANALTFNAWLEEQEPTAGQPQSRRQHFKQMGITDAQLQGV